jgi:hypothetical protein
MDGGRPGGLLAPYSWQLIATRNRFVKLRYLLLPVATALAGLLLGACDPIQIDLILSSNVVVNEPPPAGEPDAGQPPDEGEDDAGHLPTNEVPDAGCWQSRELVADVTHSAFAFDSQGLGRIAVSKSDNRIYVGSTWPGDVLAPAGELRGSVRGLTLDAEGDRHLLISLDGHTHYGHEESGSWQSTLAVWDSEPVALTVDRWGFAHILLTQTTDNGLQLGHATNRSGPWVVTDLGVRMDYFRDNRPDIVVDAQGNAHIAWRSDFGIGVFYATNASGSWVSERVEDIESSSPVLALDPLGRPHLLYAYGRWYAHHAVKQSGTWTINGVGASVGGAIDLKVDAAGNLHALLDRSQNPKIVYATRRAGSGTWRYTPILGLEGQAGATDLEQSVLGLDAAGTVFVGYRYEVLGAGNSVRYARPCP